MKRRETAPPVWVARKPVPVEVFRRNAEEIAAEHGLTLNEFIDLGRRDALRHWELRDAWLILGDVLMQHEAGCDAEAVDEVR